MGHRGCVIFVGSLPLDVREREIEDLFYKYGRIRNIDLKTPLRPPAYAFVEFTDPRDAQDAVRSRDGYDFGGQRLRVEISRGSQDSFGGGGGGGGYFGGRGGGRDRDDYGGGGFNRGRREVPPPAPASFHGRGTGFRALVKGLPQSASWQDLKDHFRKVVKPSYTNVFRDRSGLIGVVEFENQDDLDLAIRKLDDTEFKNPFERCFVRVIDDSDYKTRNGGTARSRSRSGSRRRSYSSSASRSRSRSKSPSRSPAASDKSKSPEPSKSRSPEPEASAEKADSPGKVDTEED